MLTLDSTPAASIRSNGNRVRITSVAINGRSHDLSVQQVVHPNLKNAAHAWHTYDAANGCFNGWLNKWETDGGSVAVVGRETPYAK